MVTAMPDRSKDPNQNAYRVFLESIGELPKTIPGEKPEKVVDPSKNPHAVALGRLGGLKGGAARAAALSPTKRSLFTRAKASEPCPFGSRLQRPAPVPAAPAPAPVALKFGAPWMQ